MKVLLINGPPRSGKDTVARVLSERGPVAVRRVAFADKLKKMTHRLYCRQEYPPLYYEHCKDEPHPDFFGLTPRDAYIAVSERLMKPTHGHHIFGEILRRHMVRIEQGPLFRSGSRLFVVTDCGFREEAQVLVEHYGAEHVALMRLHSPDRDFSGDSRGYIDLGVRTYNIHNLMRGEERFHQALVNVLKF